MISEEEKAIIDELELKISNVLIDSKTPIVLGINALLIVLCQGIVFGYDKQSRIPIINAVKRTFNNMININVGEEDGT